MKIHSNLKKFIQEYPIGIPILVDSVNTPNHPVMLMRLDESTHVYEAKYKYTGLHVYNTERLNEVPFILIDEFDFSQSANSSKIDKCQCPIQSLMFKGCECGHIERYKQ